MTPETIEAAGGLASDRTLRDEFALKVMEAGLGHVLGGMQIDRIDFAIRKTVQLSYKIADAMLAEREI